MARVDCSHGIAWCIITPLDANTVHCSLGGDVRGEVDIVNDPRTIQEWIYKGTHLSCFDFKTAFSNLKEETKELVEETTLQEWRGESTWNYYEEEAEETRKTWSEQRQHEELKWRPTYSLGEEKVEEQDTISLYWK